MTNKDMKTKSVPSQKTATKKAAKNKINYPVQSAVVPQLSCHWSSSYIPPGWLESFKLLLSCLNKPFTINDSNNLKSQNTLV